MEPRSEGENVSDLQSCHNIHPAVAGGGPLATSRRHPGIFPTFSLPQYHSITSFSLSSSPYFTLFPLLLLCVHPFFFLAKVFSHLMFPHAVTEKAFFEVSCSQACAFLYSAFFSNKEQRSKPHRHCRDLPMSFFLVSFFSHPFFSSIF